MKVISTNKRATFEYHIEQKFTAGIQLQGSEVKSIRAGKVSINEAYVMIRNSEAFVLNMHIAKFEASSIFNHEETRTRKLLLNRSEINKLIGLKDRGGYTIIPLQVQLHQGLIKLEIAVAKGKKLFDKRDSIKERDLEREKRQELKSKNRY
ncbi:SsrA-binding protein SmpB [Acholeplasma equirhinis]|uniref:SsrA-binding protein SmpB n=1 Tax=Acholeplasma equirhinis TaxID=555393 RepID=UPI00197AB73B|nr:SsrA-binding protein SmpB [Acholeplasma equirhinis]MBN3490618.1 SsrA-binding protein SmpB [Acholeplasma equirhinis]